MSNDFVPMKPPRSARCKIRCTHWHGPPPKRGVYLRTEGPRARLCYRILKTDWKWDEARKCWHGPVWVRKLPIRELPADAIVRYWVWAKRKKKLSQLAS